MRQDTVTEVATNKKAFGEIRDVVAGGASSNMRVRGFTVPLVVERAAGSRIWDVEGNELIDVNMGYGPHIIGYADARYAKDVAAQLAEGSMTGLPHRLDRIAAGLIAELVPSIQQVRFASSGTEALMSAIRLARMSTDRTLVVTFEGHYHGWSETLLRQAAVPGERTPHVELGPAAGAPGMIPEALSHTIQVPWNDVEQLHAAFAQYGDRIAAVVCEPVLANAGVIPPAPGFLAEIRDTTSRYGALLVFDEVITGFRVARGGAQELYGVAPDLTVLSKVLGGGFPVAAFGGNTEVMAPLARNEAFHAGVYAGNHAAMAAAVSMLTRVRDETDLYVRLEAAGLHAETRLREVFAQAGQPFWIGRSGSVISVALATRHLGVDEETVAGPLATDYDGHRELQARCQANGVYFHPDPREPWFLSTRHTEQDIETVCATVAAALVDLP